MARKIVITSGKGGAGKTTVCANLGIALAKKSQRVLLMDLDIGLNNLDVLMRVENKAVYDLIDVVEGRCRPGQALIQDENEPTLYVMPSNHRAKRPVTPDVVARVTDRLSDSFNYVLIDCPAGIDSGFRRAVNCADEAIVVVTPHASGIKDAQKAMEKLQGLTSVNVVINRVRGDLIVDGEMLSVFEVFSLLGGNSLGVIPESDNLNCNLRPYDGNAAFDLLASNLISGSSDIYDCVTKFKGLFGKIRRKFKRNV